MAWTKKIDSSSANIPTSFDETAGSLIENVKAASRLMVINYTEKILAVSVGDATAAPSSSFSTNPNQLICPAGAGGVPAVLTCDDILISNNTRIYLRSDSGSAASSGVVYVSTWVRQ